MIKYVPDEKCLSSKLPIAVPVPQSSWLASVMTFGCQIRPLSQSNGPR